MNRKQLSVNVVRVMLGCICLFMISGIIFSFIPQEKVQKVAIVETATFHKPLNQCSGNSTKETKVELAGRAVNLDPSQAKLMQKAHIIGKTVGHHPETIQGILMAETLAGKLGKIGDGGASLGEMQTQIHAARAVLEVHPQLGTFKTDAQLRNRLLTDSEFAIKVGALYFNILHQYYAHIKDPHKRWRAAVLCYNAGPKNVNRKRDPQQYVKMVEDYMKHTVRPFNKVLKA
jgi:hypothetical protein